MARLFHEPRGSVDGVARGLRPDPTKLQRRLPIVIFSLM